MSIPVSLDDAYRSRDPIVREAATNAQRSINHSHVVSLRQEVRK